jgi:glutathione synthase/RimK-type ligase-like ATP-grasp enzyme
MNILILGGNSGGDEDAQMADYVAYFQKTLTDKGQTTDVKHSYLDELVFWVTPKEFSVTDSRNNQDLADYDMVIIRGKIRANSYLAFCVSKYLALKEVPFFNDYSAYRGPFTKLGQSLVMHELGLPFPATLYAQKQTTLTAAIDGKLQFPLIAKDILGAHGEHNYLVRSMEELEAAFKTSAGVPLLLQECIPNEGDFRILVVGDKHLVIKRQAVGDSHLNNTSQGGQATLVTDLNPETVTQAHELAKAVQMKIAGVDVIENSQTGEHLFLEINSQPQIVTGAFTDLKADLMGDYIIETLTPKA